MDKGFEKRKKVVYDLMCDSLYTPMKFKELAMLLQVPKENRDELRKILEALEKEGKICLSKRGKYCKGEAKKCKKVEILKTVLMIIFAIDCIALSAIVLLQEGKSAGLGTISGMADSYWGQNKGRSMEGALVKSTKFLAVLFIVLAAVLNLKVFA